MTSFVTHIWELSQKTSSIIDIEWGQDKGNVVGNQSTEKKFVPKACQLVFVQIPAYGSKVTFYIDL